MILRGRVRAPDFSIGAVTDSALLANQSHHGCLNEAARQFVEQCLTVDHGASMMGQPDFAVAINKGMYTPTANTLGAPVGARNGDGRLNAREFPPQPPFRVSSTPGPPSGTNRRRGHGNAFGEEICR